MEVGTPKYSHKDLTVRTKGQLYSGYTVSGELVSINPRSTTKRIKQRT